MRHRLALVLVMTAAVAACQKKEPAAEAAGEATTAAEVAADAAAPSRNADAAAGASSASPGPEARVRKPPVTVPELAYSYDYNVRTPGKALPGLVRQHESACVLVGPTVCQVVGASTEGIGTDEVTGELKLRATPEFIGRFRERIEGDIEAMGGKIETSGTDTEDLSRSLVDTGAEMRAKIELRDRLRALADARRGKLSDLVEIEQQLAQVQGEIDAARSDLSVMGTRVKMASMTIRYQSLTGLAPDSAFAPVKQAVNGFVRNSMGGVAFLITTLSVLLPFGGAAWLIWNGFFRRRRKVVPVAAATEG